jgi:ABC-type multidrug transport system fused ATPase/permease subunit
VNKAFSEALAKQIQAIFTLVIGLGISFSASYKVSLVVLATFPLNIIASAIQMQGIAGQQYDTQDTDSNPTNSSTADKSKGTVTKPTAKDSAVSSSKKNDGKYAKLPNDSSSPESQPSQSHGALISTAFTHMRTICALSMQYHVENEYSRLTRKLRDRRMSRSHVSGFGFGGSQFSLFCTYALLFWYGSTLVKSGEIDFERKLLSKAYGSIVIRILMLMHALELMTAILCLMLGALGLGQALVDIGDQTAGIEVAGKIFTEIEDSARSKIDGLSDTQGIIPLAANERSKGEIELKHLSFFYPTRRNVQVCDDYSLKIEPGEVVALVGSSGSGKVS